MADWRRFRRVLLVAALILVVVLIVFAIRQAFGSSSNENTEPLPPTTSTANVASPTIGQPGVESLQMNAADASLTVTCEQSQQDGAFALNVNNAGPEQASFTVLSTLTTDSGRLVDVVTDIENLLADEFRRVVLFTDNPGPFRSCQILAIEHGQQVLRRN